MPGFSHGIYGPHACTAGTLPSELSSPVVLRQSLSMLSKLEFVSPISASRMLDYRPKFPSPAHSHHRFFSRRIRCLKATHSLHPSAMPHTGSHAATQRGTYVWMPFINLFSAFLLFIRLILIWSVNSDIRLWFLATSVATPFGGKTARSYSLQSKAQLVLEKMEGWNLGTE